MRTRIHREKIKKKNIHVKIEKKKKRETRRESEKLQFQWLRGATWLRDARITCPPFVEALLRSRDTTLW